MMKNTGQIELLTMHDKNRYSSLAAEKEAAGGEIPNGRGHEPRIE